jgi:hypothetical protein
MERIVNELDGTGRGYGKYRGITVAEFERLLESCRRDPTMRGASAVLRIAREQIEARGDLSVHPFLFGTCLLLFVASLAAHQYATGFLRQWADKVAIACGFLALLHGYVTFTTWRDRREASYQERRIREAALDALVEIVRAPGFSPKPLDFTQELTLKRLLKRTRRRDPELLQLLGRG